MDTTAVHSKYQNTYDSITSEEDKRNFIAEIGVEREQYRQDAINAKVAYNGLKMGIQVARDKRKQEDSYKDDKRIFSKCYHSAIKDAARSGLATVTEWGYLLLLSAYTTKDNDVARKDDGSVMTKVDMAEEWDKSRSTISYILKGMVEKGLLREIKEGNKTGYEVNRMFIHNGI